MPDELDLAQEADAADRERALQQLRRFQPLPADGPKDCRRCGDPIPEERRAAVPGTPRCVVCQGIYERAHAAGF